MMVFPDSLAAACKRFQIQFVDFVGFVLPEQNGAAVVAGDRSGSTEATEAFQFNLRESVCDKFERFGFTETVWKKIWLIPVRELLKVSRSSALWEFGRVLNQHVTLRAWLWYLTAFLVSDTARST